MNTQYENTKEIEIYLSELKEKEKKLNEELTNIINLKIKTNKHLEKSRRLDTLNQYKRYFFIDSENVRNEKLKDILNFKSSDIVYFFHGHSISKKTFSLLFETKAKIKYIPIEITTKNAMDLELISHLSDIIKNKRKGSFVLISEDKGFDISLEFLTQKKSKCKDIIIAKSSNCNLDDLVLFKPKENQVIKEINVKYLLPEKIQKNSINKIKDIETSNPINNKNNSLEEKDIKNPNLTDNKVDSLEERDTEFIKVFNQKFKNNKLISIPDINSILDTFNSKKSPMNRAFNKIKQLNISDNDKKVLYELILGYFIKKSFGKKDEGNNNLDEIFNLIKDINQNINLNISLAKNIEIYRSIVCNIYKTKDISSFNNRINNTYSNFYVQNKEQLSNIFVKYKKK